MLISADSQSWPVIGRASKHSRARRISSTPRFASIRSLPSHGPALRSPTVACIGPATTAAPRAWKKPSRRRKKPRELQPDAGETFLARGYYEYIVVRDYDAAWSAFKEGVLRLPNNADALLSLSFIERRKGRWAEAVAHQEQAARLDPQSVPVLSQLGVTYFALKRFTDAHTIVDRLLGLAPENPQVLAGLARLDLAEGNLEAAETAMRSVAAGAKQRLRFRDSGAARADCRPSRRGNPVNRKCLRANDGAGRFFRGQISVPPWVRQRAGWRQRWRSRGLRSSSRGAGESYRSPARIGRAPDVSGVRLRPGWPTKRRPLPPPKKRSLCGRPPSMP